MVRNPLLKHFILSTPISNYHREAKAHAGRIPSRSVTLGKPQTVRFIHGETPSSQLRLTGLQPPCTTNNNIYKEMKKAKKPGAGEEVGGDVPGFLIPPRQAC